MRIYNIGVNKIFLFVNLKPKPAEFEWRIDGDLQKRKRGEFYGNK